MFVAAVAAAIFQVPACYGLVRRMGYLGAPLALFLSNLIVLAFLLMAAARSPAAVTPTHLSHAAPPVGPPDASATRAPDAGERRRTF